MRKKILLFSCCIILLPVMLAGDYKRLKEYDSQISRKSLELKKIEEDLKQKRQARDEEKKKEEMFRKALARIESALASLVQRQREIKRRMNKAHAALQLAQKSLRSARSNVTVRHSDFVSGINNLWLSRTYFRLVVFRHTDFELRDIIRQKTKLYKDARSKEQLCEFLVAKWQMAKNDLALLEKNLNENLSQQKNLREEKRKLLTDATARRVAIEEEIKSLNETSRALQDMISKLESKKRKTREKMAEEEQARKKVSKMMGNLPWPVKGEIVVKFGKTKRENIDIPVISNGIKIKTSPRSPVTAVASGDCVFAGNFRSYGQMVVIDHGGEFYSVYGLLDDISVKNNDRISVGQKVGISGNDEGLVYFEVRVDGQPVDPLLWLGSR